MVAVGTAFQLLPSLFFVNHVLSFFFSLYLISRNCKEYIYIYIHEWDGQQNIASVSAFF